MQVCLYLLGRKVISDGRIISIAIDNRRLLHRVGQLSAPLRRQLDENLKIVLDLS
jgi:hypothetical protein